MRCAADRSSRRRKGIVSQALRATAQAYQAGPILRQAAVVVVPALVLAEVDWFLRQERPAMRRLVSEILDPATRYELEPVHPADLVRALRLDAHFEALELGLVDGSVAAVAERRRIPRVLTTDQRDFGALRVGPRLDRPLRLVP